MKIIFIASLDHSGSTLLDKILGSHSKVVGLGEIELTIKRFINGALDTTKHICSCRENVKECLFWSKVFDQWKRYPNLDVKKAYEIVISIFSTLYKDKILVDSSKYFSALHILTEMSEYELYVIHLMKDVRAFSVSKNDRIREKRGNLNSFSSLKLFRTWYNFNVKMQQYLGTNDIKSSQIGYEEICLSPQLSMSLLCRNLDITFEENMVDLRNTKSHILLGNRMRLSRDKESIVYDARWFTRNSWVIPSLIFSKIMQFNKMNTYSLDTVRLYSR